MTNPPFLPVFRPHLVHPEKYLHRLFEIAACGTYTNGGAQSEEFISHLAKHFRVKTQQIVIGSSATALITGAAAILNQDSFYVPSWTFAATVHGVANAGSSIRFLDVNVSNHTVEPPDIPAGSGAVIVAPFGRELTLGGRFDSLNSLIVDAAASIAHPVQVESDSAIARRLVEVYSLHATKVMGIGEGGVAVVRNENLATQLRSWTNFGFTGGREAVHSGSNSKMSEFLAAIGCATILEFEEEKLGWLTSRRHSFAIEERLGLPHFHQVDSVSPYWILSLPDQESRDRVALKFRENQIDTRLWWSRGCHRMAAFENYPRKGPLDNTEHLANTTIGLPFSRNLKSGDFERIEAALSEVIR